MKTWPPVKAWTSLSLEEDNNFFIAINYGYLKRKKWVHMVSIISGKNSFYVDFKDLNDETLWMEGWQELPFNRLDKIEENKMKVNVMIQNIAI